MATYYVATTGNDSNPGTIVSPKLTIAAGIALLASGDTLNIRAGTYAEGITEAQLVGKSGSSYAAPTTIRAYQTEVVTLTGDKIELNGATGFSTSYVIFQGDPVAKNFVVSGHRIGLGTSFQSGQTGTAHHIKFDGVTVTGVPGGPGSAQAVGVGDSNASDNWFTNMHVHTNGQPSDGCNSGGPAPHGFYIEGPRNIVENTEIDHCMGSGVQNYDQHSGSARDNIYRNNYVHHNGLIAPPACEQTTFGITLATGVNNIANNNIIANNASGLGLSSGAVAYNNTIYGNSNSFSWCCWEAIRCSGPATVRNNIIFNNQFNAIYNPGGISSNNLIGNPLFTNAAGADFTLTPFSPAINAGTTNITSGITITDFFGSAPDMGALEFGEPTPFNYQVGFTIAAKTAIVASPVIAVTKIFSIPAYTFIDLHSAFNNFPIFDGSSADLDAKTALTFGTPKKGLHITITL